MEINAEFTRVVMRFCFLKSSTLVHFPKITYYHKRAKHGTQNIIQQQEYVDCHVRGQTLPPDEEYIFLHTGRKVAFLLPLRKPEVPLSAYGTKKNSIHTAGGNNECLGPTFPPSVCGTLMTSQKTSECPAE